MNEMPLITIVAAHILTLEDQAKLLGLLSQVTEYDVFRLELPAWVGECIVPEHFTESKKNLTTALEKLSVVHLTLAYAPRHSEIVRISNLIRQKFQNQALLDFRIQPDVIGGAIIEYQGKRTDMTIKNYL